MKVLKVVSLCLYSLTSGKKTNSFDAFCLMASKSIMFALWMMALHFSSKIFFFALYSSLSSLYWLQKQQRQAIESAPIPIKVPSRFSITKITRCDIISCSLLMKDQNKTQEPIFLGKYKWKKLLGKGAFGTVHLVEEGANLFAMKLIQKQKMTGDNEYLVEYLKGEVNCMKEMKEEHFVKLQAFHEDDKYFYLLLEYCDGGDLLNLQATLPDKVFPLHMALQLMSQVILGLQALHSRGYLHRDIKPQNVLIKNVLGKNIAKLADFGFAKKAKYVEGTIIGTEHFMSPEIYLQGMDESRDSGKKETYGFEVDVWAFGVLLFYMLNSSYPFQIVPAWTFQMKFAEITKQAQDFSYQKKVSKSRKKIMQNCTDELEDLFLKIFTVDKTKRITFQEMRTHPAFLGFFTQLTPFMAGLNGSKEKTYAQQKLILSLQMEEINFLSEVADNVHQVEKNIGQLECLMFAYSLTKYHIILLQRFARELKAQKYVKKYPQLDWANFFSTNSSGEAKEAMHSCIKRARIKYDVYYEKCQQSLPKLIELNDRFGKSFRKEIFEVGLEDAFYISYKQSINLVYQNLKQFLKEHKILSYYCLLSTVCICYVYKNIYDLQQPKKSIFSEYLAHQKEVLPKFSYKRLVEYLRSCKKEEYIMLAKKIISECSSSLIE